MDEIVILKTSDEVHMHTTRTRDMMIRIGCLRRFFRPRFQLYEPGIRTGRIIFQYGEERELQELGYWPPRKSRPNLQNISPFDRPYIPPSWSWRRW